MAACRHAVLALVAALACPQAAWSDEVLPEAQYFIKQERPTTGSNIPRRIYQGSDIPINRTYAQLSSAERQLVKSQYEAMADADEPPFPAEGLKPIYDAIAKVQGKLLEKGLLSMHADVDASGLVTGVSVYQSPDPIVTQAAASILVLTKFKPAVCGGTACKMVFPLRVTFKVDR